MAIKNIGRKPAVSLVGLPPELSHALQPVVTTLNIITGSPNREIRKLSYGCTQSEIVEKINEIAARLNASGEVK